MERFAEIMQKEREDLSKRREEILRQKEDLDRQLAEIDREFAAIDAYERTRKGQGAAPAASTGKRRTGVRQEVLDTIKRHPNGIRRADLLEEMGAKGDKRAEQSVSNALANLKKQGQVTLEEGVYKTA